MAQPDFSIRINLLPPISPQSLRLLRRTANARNVSYTPNIKANNITYQPLMGHKHYRRWLPKLEETLIISHLPEFVNIYPSRIVLMKWVDWLSEQLIINSKLSTLKLKYKILPPYIQQLMKTVTLGLGTRGNTRSNRNIRIE